MTIDDKYNSNDLGIFQNQEKVAENIKESAEGIGLDINGDAIESLAKGLPQEVRVANSKCKFCWGKGTVNFVQNKLERNYKKPEDPCFKRDNIEKFLCKCVKTRLV